jgi:hypothetical protein
MKDVLYKLFKRQLKMESTLNKKLNSKLNYLILIKINIYKWGVLQLSNPFLAELTETKIKFYDRKQSFVS